MIRLPTLLSLSVFVFPVLGCTDKSEADDSGTTVTVPTDVDGDGFAEGDDCDDADSGVNPDAEEVCDEVDNNCDGAIDEAGGSVWYADSDGDGYGNDNETTEACDAPSGYAESGGDCDDTDPAYNPGATEDDCSDPNDYNCDGSVAYEDVDGDGYPACEDCDDADPAQYPGVDELCNGEDDDCDGDTDEDAIDGTTWYADEDEDGYGNDSLTTSACEAPTGYVSDNTDCDDVESSINPAATEVCDSTDNNCDGLTDDEDAGLDTTTGTTWYADNDGDTYGDSSNTVDACEAPAGYLSDDTDCDDGAASINPAATEVCDRTDNDCDGLTDDDDTGLDTSTGTTWYADDDRDTYGDSTNTVDACEAPGGYVSDDTDCDDGESSINPAATEVCDRTDNNCDGLTDDDDTGLDTSTGTTWYADSDRDTYGDSTNTVDACEAPAGYISDDTDCDDGEASINPAATEVCDSIDNDCDGLTDDDDTGLDTSTGTTWYADVDGDTYGDSTNTVDACEAPSGYLSDDTDCDDGDGDVYPGAPNEVLHDGVDQDCDDFDGYTVADLAVGDLIITEIMANPAAVNDSRGEYFEFYNDSGIDVDLNGLVFADNVSSATVSDTLVSETEGYVVFAIDGDTASNGGFDADFDWSGPALANAGDIITLSYDGMTLDEVDYAGWTVTAGVSMNLDPTADATDNDDGSYWCEATSTFGLGDYGSPGAENDLCFYNLGNDVELGETVPAYADYLLGSALEVPEDVTLDSFSLIFSSGSVNVKMALYSDTGGAPDALVASTDSTAISGGGLVEIDIDDVSLPAGSYWLVAVYDTDVDIVYTSDTTAMVSYRSHAFSDDLPDPFGTVVTYTGQEFNYYITVY